VSVCYAASAAFGAIGLAMTLAPGQVAVVMLLAALGVTLALCLVARRAGDVTPGAGA
jgi:hypothetical protein